MFFLVISEFNKDDIRIHTFVYQLTCENILENDKYFDVVGFVIENLKISRIWSLKAMLELAAKSGVVWNDLTCVRVA